LNEVIARLPQGFYDTLLKWFAKGTNLSGRIAARIALARAFVRQAQIIDPLAISIKAGFLGWFDWFIRTLTIRHAMIITPLPPGNALPI